ncbi:M24 family metallopeptidase [Rhizobium mongolense]|uniref:Xaa-Pro dipeptidase/ectoine hydrolase n=2 Tax=Rhizobium mongolense TaxID=57676 RepID=A0ABR6IZW6_9HYPH|nr:Xaa-Pro peptidase family protein [Rhizobium mongolense]MBB4233308.1 Xaa-Pro dipeptidase/ectoine hydrolase [Rhizobium mongolense]TVZ75082.1 Xaa-Pro dipeptidase/ectoine hydrolase [Rhizobium mongolense USDA 1844]
MTMPKAAQVFPRSEFLRRLAAVKAEMEQKDIDVLIITNIANITYLTGYTAKTGKDVQAVLVSLKDEEPTFITRRQDAPGGRHLMFVDSSRVIGYPEDLVANPDPHKDEWDAIIDLLLDDGFGRREIGIELKILTCPVVEKFKRRMPEARFKNFDRINWIRGIKSDLEIAVMREAAAISDAAMLRAQEVIRPDVTEVSAAAEIISTLINGVDGKPGGDLASFFLCASPRISTPHIRWTEDVFRQGSQANLELAGVRHSYVTPLMRTISIGTPSDRLRRVHEAEVAGLEAALAAVKPGATCSDVATAFYTTLQKHGFEKESRCGYAIGIDWTEPTASLRTGDLTVLKPNMTFHLMLGNWIDDDFGYVISESFRVTETGVETFSTLPREIFEV